MNAGSASHPRRVEDDVLRALSVSISHSGKRLQDLLQRDPALDSCERGAQAVVDAVAEAEVLDPGAMDVEAIAVGDDADRRGWPTP